MRSDPWRGEHPRPWPAFVLTRSRGPAPALLGEDSDINAFRLFDQAIDWIALPRRPTAALAVSDKNLRHPMIPGKRNDLRDRVRALQYVDFGAQPASEIQIGVQRLLVFALQIGLSHVGDE